VSDRVAGIELFEEAQTELALGRFAELYPEGAR
jgi:hypothetical protein